MHMLSYIHYSFICFLSRPPDTTVGSYQWSLVGKVFNPVYTTCDLTQMCGSIIIVSTVQALIHFDFDLNSI